METTTSNTEPAEMPKASAPRQISFEDAVCDLCGQVPTEHLVRTEDLVWRKPGQFNLVRCRECGLIMTSPRPVPADMGVYYQDWYTYADDLQTARDRQAHCLGNRFTAWSRLRLLERTGPLERGMRVLDVGAGFGVQLDYFIRHRGVVATSLDFDPKTCAVSVLKGKAELLTGDLLDAGLEAESFDVLTFYESLEHFYRPKATLQEAYRILKPGGRLAIDVPDFGAWWRGIWGRYWFGILAPTHLWHFTRNSLRRVVTAAGFRPLVHESLFWPYEATASLMVAYGDVTGFKPIDLLVGSRLWKNKPQHLPFFALSCLWAVAVDLPWQVPLWLFNRTGTQGLIAIKPQSGRRTTD